MTNVTASKLRSNLFALLMRVAKGEIISIRLNGEEVGRIVPVRQKDWRKKMSLKPKLSTSPDKAFAPLDDIWQDYK